MEHTTQGFSGLDNLGENRLAAEEEAAAEVSRIEAESVAAVEEETRVAAEAKIARVAADESTDEAALIEAKACCGGRCRSFSGTH